jgi:hypothetical protein
MTHVRFPMASDDPGWGWWLRHGVAGGVLAGLVFAAFEILAATMTSGASAWPRPLRMIGAIVLGRGAMDAGAPLLPPVAAGLLLHVGLAAAFGGVFGVMAWAGLAGPTTRLVATGGAYGLLLWLVNFHMIAPIAGWRWFPDRTDPVVQLVAHVLFYGAPLGLYLTRTRGHGVTVGHSAVDQRPCRAA